mgnify:CR=1 FL=1
MFKTLFSVFETDKLDRFHDTEIVAMMAIMGVVVTHDASVVAGVQPVVDVCEVVAGDLARNRIDPDLPAQLAVAPFVGNLVGLVDVLRISDDSISHGCLH